MLLTVPTKPAKFIKRENVKILVNSYYFWPLDITVAYSLSSSDITCGLLIGIWVVSAKEKKKLENQYKQNTQFSESNLLCNSFITLFSLKYHIHQFMKKMAKGSWICKSIQLQFKQTKHIFFFKKKKPHNQTNKTIKFN